MNWRTDDPSADTAAADRQYAANLAQWDERAPAHAASPDYNLAGYAADPDHVSGIVAFDLPLLGEVRGLRGVHLQCHLGTDTISLARLGARMTGLDYSPAAIAEARALSQQCGTPVEFVVADVHDAPEALGRGRFDLVFTGIGALCWLPSIRRWAGVVHDLLAPGGRLFLREAHPMMWALGEPDGSGLVTVEYPYFEQLQPTRWDEDGTYVQSEATFQHTTSYGWNHGLGEIVTALLDQGMVITGLVEHDSVPWNDLGELMADTGTGEYRLVDRPERLAASYTLQARKPG